MGVIDKVLSKKKLLSQSEDFYDSLWEDDDSEDSNLKAELQKYQELKASVFRGLMQAIKEINFQLIDSSYVPDFDKENSKLVSFLEGLNTDLKYLAYALKNNNSSVLAKRNK